MNKLRFAIIGVGNMGSSHANYIPKMEDATVSAICDIDAAKREKFAAQLNVPAFASAEELLAAKVADAVIVATPHYDHPPIGIRALETGHHLLVEKPIAVGVKAARELNAAAKKFPNQKFGIMFNQRSNPMYQKLRELIADGELGEITRVTWLITDWFRTHTYYASGGWRATWAGEGGGVLINQCPHNLDLLQWITGMMPNRITAVGFIGKTHPIEVEDEMSAILEYPNGAIGHFVTSTGEAPGTNRLEICGDRGKIIAEKGKLSFSRTRKSVKEIKDTSPESFAHVEKWEIDVPYKSSGNIGEHERVTRNFVSACLKETPLLSPGEEGVKGLELSNAMIMSAMQRRGVDLPINGDEYDQLLIDLAKKYGGKKTLETKKVEADMAASSASFA
ncbi:MAG: Gfo/Idh/MocA family oxidoreductase [Burkholderiales bacterium]|nr:Gfo/Idh/MocA family oxidoreductase [Phycisphaerae bacterium]